MPTGAYEGNRIVFATLVSTDLPGGWTSERMFRLWVKLQTGKMSGGSIERSSLILHSALSRYPSIDPD